MALEGRRGRPTPASPTLARRSPPSSGTGERGRLIGRAWDHHVAGAYEASIPIVLAQIDGITADATLSPTGRRGKMFFFPSGSHYVEVVDDTTLLG